MRPPLQWGRPAPLCYTLLMNIRCYLAMQVAATIAIIAPSANANDAWISVEVATEQGVQATAQREWLQLLTRAGADDIRLRSQQPGDEAALSQSGTAERPRYRLVGVLDGRGILTLPGGRFKQRSVSELRDYFDRLAADGNEGVTAPRGAFGLTEKQIAQVHDDLARPVEFSTTGVPLADVLKAVDNATRLAVRMDEAAWQVVREAPPAADEVQSITMGTALALLLLRDSLVLVPSKARGAEVVLRIARHSDIKAGKASDDDLETWPVGWKPNRQPSQLAPKLIETLTAEVDGFTLAEAMASIEPRVGVPVYWDHQKLAANQIDPTQVKVKLARQKTRLGRVIDRLLFQARLRGELKVDEAGTVFYWISR